MSSRTVYINKGYLNSERIPNEKIEFEEGYFHISNIETIVLDQTEEIHKVLSPEVDIFTDLPKSVYENEHANLFLKEMKKCIMDYNKSELEGVVLSKLIVSEDSSMSTVIEWIFNYFRFYFSFDNVEGDYYGEIENDFSKGVFRNSFTKMDIKDFRMIANNEIRNAVLMAKGDT